MTFLERICTTLNQADVRYLLVGGHAVALHGAIRGTIDVDIALRWTEADINKAEKALKKIGLISRLPLTAKDVFLYREEYVRNRNLIAWNFHNLADPTEQLDIIINFDASGKRATYKKVGDLKIPVINIRDLIQMKKNAGRPQDLEDVRALESLL